MNRIVFTIFIFDAVIVCHHLDSAGTAICGIFTLLSIWDFEIYVFHE